MKNIFQHSPLSPPLSNVWSLWNHISAQSGAALVSKLNRKTNVFLRVEKVNTLRQ